MRYAAGLRAGAEQVAQELGTDDVAPVGTAVAADANVFELVGGSAAPDGGDALARERAVGCRAVLVRRFVEQLLDGDFAHRFSSP